MPSSNASPESRTHPMIIRLSKDNCSAAIKTKEGKDRDETHSCTQTMIMNNKKYYTLKEVLGNTQFFWIGRGGKLTFFAFRIRYADVIICAAHIQLDFY